MALVGGSASPVMASSFADLSVLSLILAYRKEL